MITADFFIRCNVNERNGGQDVNFFAINRHATFCWDRVVATHEVNGPSSLPIRTLTRAATFNS